MFYCRDNAEINGCGSLQTSSWLDSDVLRSRQQKHTAVRLPFKIRNNPLLQCPFELNFSNFKWPIIREADNANKYE